MDKNRELHSLLLAKENDIDEIIRLSISNFSGKDSINSFYQDLSKEELISNFLKNFRGKKINIVEMCSGSGIYGVLLAKFIGLSGTLHLVDIVGSYHKKAKKIGNKILSFKKHASNKKIESNFDPSKLKMADKFIIEKHQPTDVSSLV